MKLIRIFLATVILEVGAFASTIGSVDIQKRASDHCYNYAFTAQYDDLPFQENPGPNPIPTSYLGLTYKNFYVSRNNGFIPATSGTQFAMSFDSSKPRTISAASGSFNLKSLYLACSSGYPQNDCKVSIKGFKSSGETVVKKFTYKALDSSKPFFMSKVEFDLGKWRGLKSMEFVKVEIDGTGSYTGLMVDDLNYVVELCG